MNTPDCSTCHEDCADRGQPQNMRTVGAEEECAMNKNVVARGIFRSEGRDLAGKTACERHLEDAMQWLAEKCCGDESPDWWILQALAATRPEPNNTGGGLAAIVGQWPGDETDAEIEAALENMHGMGECPTCHGLEVVVTCVDDMCRGLEHCLHGDGEAPCPECAMQQTA